MSATFLKTVLKAASIAGALFGVFLLVYVGRVIWGASDDQFSAAHPFIAFYGGHLIYQAVVFQRRYSPRFVHGFLSTIMCPIGFVSCVGIMSSGFSTTVIRGTVTLLVFLLIGVIYKFLLGYFGRTLFGKEIIE